MKIKFFTFLLALAMSTLTYAGNVSLVSAATASGEEIVEENHYFEMLSLNSNCETSINASDEWVNPETLTCTISATISIGSDKIFAKATATVTVSGDCEEVVEMLIKKIDEVKAGLR